MKNKDFKGYQRILIENNYAGLAQYIDSINQECVILFDEFEKICFNDVSANAMSNFADGYSKACVSTLMKCRSSSMCCGAT